MLIYGKDCEDRYHAGLVAEMFEIDIRIDASIYLKYF